MNPELSLYFLQELHYPYALDNLWRFFLFDIYIDENGNIQSYLTTQKIIVIKKLETETTTIYNCICDLNVTSLPCFQIYYTSNEYINQYTIFTHGYLQRDAFTIDFQSTNLKDIYTDAIKALLKCYLTQIYNCSEPAEGHALAPWQQDKEAVVGYAMNKIFKKNAQEIIRATLKDITVPDSDIETIVTRITDKALDLDQNYLTRQDISKILLRKHRETITVSP
jgi:hypothetical protein